MVGLFVFCKWKFCKATCAKQVPKPLTARRPHTQTQAQRYLRDNSEEGVHVLQVIVQLLWSLVQAVSEVIVTFKHDYVPGPASTQTQD